MIFTDRTIIVQKGTSSINDTIVLYRGDKEVEIRFTLNESSPFRFGSGASPNIIEKTEAAYGQLVIKTPNDLPAIFSEVVPTNEGKIIFTITAEMIDEITEVGNYTFQIRLLDESMNSRATLPEVVNGIEIREPIATEGVSTSNEVGVATVGYAMTTAGTTEDTFDSQGNYNKTTWGTGDRITAAKLNKIEVGIDGVNKKAGSVATLIPTKTSQLTNDSDFATNTSVDEKIGNIEISSGLILRDATDGEVFTLASTGSGETYGKIVVSTYSISVTEGESSSFTVKLDAAPTTNQIVSISLDNSDVNVNPSSLTFTSANYNVEQTVTVNTVSDADTTTDYCNIVLNTNSNNSIIVLTINEPSTGGGSEGSFVSITDGLVHAYDYKNIESNVITDLVGTDNLTINSQYVSGTDYGIGYVQNNSGTNYNKFTTTLFETSLSSYTILMRVSPISAAASTTLIMAGIEWSADPQLIDWGVATPGLFKSGTTAKTSENLFSYGENPIVIGFMVNATTFTESVVLNGEVKASATGTKTNPCRSISLYAYKPEKNKFKYYECVVFNRELTSEELVTVSNDLLAKGGN